MPLANSEIHLILTWSENCPILSATGKAKRAITKTAGIINICFQKINYLE